MIKDNNRHLRIHKLMTTFLTLKKMIWTNSSTKISAIKKPSIQHYIANYNQYPTHHYVKLAKQNQEKISKIHKKKYLPVLIR